jgi:hypothetical protein
MTRHTRILIAGAALILAGNAVALIGVVYNRSGQPDAVVEFSERELPRPYNYLASKENSGLALHLNWRSTDTSGPVLPGILSRGGSPSPWLDKDKLAALGFDVSADPKGPDAVRRYRKILPRKAYVVMEFNGPAYQAAVQQAQARIDEAKAKLAADPDNKALKTAIEYAQRQLDNEQHKNSRLFAVDVGPDQESLRSRYPDRARYIILPGQVRLMANSGAVNGYIAGLDVGTINVPLAYRAAISGEGGARPTHYTVRLAFGRRDEPWILAAQAGGEEDPTDNGGAKDLLRIN